MRRQVEVGVLARQRGQLATERVLPTTGAGDLADDVPAQPQLQAVGARQERVGPRVDVYGGADGEHVVEREDQWPRVLARVEPTPDRAPPPAEGARLAVGPRPRTSQHADRHEPPVPVLQCDVVDVAEHLLRPSEQLVVEEAQPEGQRGAGLDRPAGCGVSRHWPAPVTIISGMAATEATTTTTR